jgi:RNA ligase (TIGR02306 family)
MRNLVSIRTIDRLVPHPNADRLDLAHVGGWQCVVGKDVHHVGESVLFFEVDSVLPELPPFEFLRKSCFVSRDWVKGFRLQTRRLRGELSQGLIMPLSVLDAFGAFTFDTKDGFDLTTHIGVVKWDPPMPASLSGEMTGRFPSTIPKTDQERVQNLDLEKLPGVYEVTEKLDGTSMTVIVSATDDIRVCSRNYELRETPSNSLWEVARETFGTRFAPFTRNLAFQGELVGPGIQDNLYCLPKRAYFIFDVYDCDQSRYLTPAERTVLLADLELNAVPFIGEEWIQFNEVTPRDQIVQSLLSFAEGTSVLNPNAQREGLVFKSVGCSKSFKAISNAWLLKHE